jgi:hypothetical protein
VFAALFGTHSNGRPRGPPASLDRFDTGMRRVFLVLAGLDLLAFAAAIAVGCLSKFGDHSLYLAHFLLGLATALVTLAVHCLIFIYFLGTGRWVKEVGLAYNLPDGELPRQTRELKRAAFPPALFAMLITIATAGAGAGADTGLWPWPIHMILALVAVAVNLWAFPIEYRNLCANVIVLHEVLRAVDRIRAERGLPSNAEALEQEAGRPWTG